MNQFLSQENQEEEKKGSKQNINNSQRTKIRFCQNCGSKLDERDLFCTQCGGKVEIVQDVQNIEQESQIEEKHELQVSSDRMNAILNARKDFKSTFSEDIKNFTKEINSSTKEVAILQNRKITRTDSRLGYYLSQDRAKKEYLIIESIEGNQVAGKIRDLLDNSKYGNEFFSGTIDGDTFEINGIQRENSNCNFIWDLHFTGQISENTISGTWKRINDHSETMVYKKIL